MKIAILDDYQGVALQLADWDKLNAEITVFNEPLHDVATQLQDFEVIVAMRERTKFPASVISALPNLKLIVTTGARNASIDVEAAKKQGVTVCGTTSVEGVTVELTWGLILAAARRLDVEFNNFREGRWQTTLGIGLRGKTIGLIGVGRQGSGVAKVANAFGMNVVAYSRSIDEKKAAELGATAVSFEELLKVSDFISLHIPLNDQTEGLISKPEFEAMKSTAWLINTSRGPIVDNDALVEALDAKAIAGYAVDVFDEEPLPENHPFRRMKNIVGSPHIGYVSREMYSRWYQDAVEDIASFQNGKPQRIID